MHVFLFLDKYITIKFQVAGLLNKMQLQVEDSVLEENETKFTIAVPPTRSDILHPCDVAEVLALSFMALQKAFILAVVLI